MLNKTKGKGERICFKNMKSVLWVNMKNSFDQEKWSPEPQIKALRKSKGLPGWLTQREHTAYHGNPHTQITSVLTNLRVWAAWCVVVDFLFVLHRSQEKRDFRQLNPTQTK